MFQAFAGLGHNPRMCYSAQLQAAYMKYLRETGAQMDIDQFVEIFGARVSDSSIRIPRAVERWFEEPKTDGERRIKAFIDEYNQAETTKLEREVFAQKKRLADAERVLASKPTKAAAESKRIATDKIDKALTRLDRLKATKPHPAEARIFPLHYAPIVMQVGDKRLMRLAGERAKRHGGGHEPPANGLHWLHLLQRHRSALPHREQVAWTGGAAGGVLVQEALVGLVRLALHRLLKRHDDRRRPAVIFAVLSKAHPPVVGEGGRRLRHRGEGRAMSDQYVLRDFFEPDPPNG